MARIEITIPGERIVEEFTALVQQPVTPTGAPALKVGLVEISQTQPTELIPGPMGPQGPRGSRWSTGAGDPTVPGGVTGDMYLDDVSGAVWQWDGTAWVNTGTNIQGSPDTGPDILAKLAPVDGAGSGLDADTLDGMDSTAFATDAELTAVVSSMTAADNLRVLKAGDTMTGSLIVPVGVSGATVGLGVGAANTGLYVTGSGTASNLRMSVDGANSFHITKTSVNANNPLYAEGGNPTNPGIAFAAEPSSGWYWAAAGNVRQVIQGTVVWQSTKTGIQSNVPIDLPAANPTVGTHAAHKTYVDAQVATKLGEAPQDGLTYGRKNATWATIVGGAVISDTPPPGPLTPGQLWWESDTGNTFLWFDDGDTQQWVQQNIQPAAVPGDPPLSETWGNWTPTLTFGGNAVGLVYATRTGRWRRVGKMVTLWFYFALTAKGSSVGPCAIGGLPFAPVITPSLYSAGSVSNYTNVVSSTGGMGCLINTVGTLVLSYSASGANLTTASDVNFGNTTGIGASISYEAA